METLIQSYCDHIASTIDEEGIYPTPAIAKQADDTLTLYAMAVSPKHIFATMLTNGLDHNIVEQIFAIDTYTKDGQGTTLDSCLILFHAVRGQPARIGVLEYSWNAGQPITKPPDWNNPFWINMYKFLADDLTKVFL